MHEVLELLVTPTTCYHSFIERYFERKEREKVDCGVFCSYCNGDMNKFTKSVYKKAVVSILTTKVFAAGRTPLPSDFIKDLKADMAKIFHKDDMPKNKKMGQIHALGLQLLAKQIIALSVTDCTKIGTNDFCDKHLAVMLPNIDDDGTVMPSYLVRSSWEGLRLI